MSQEELLTTWQIAGAREMLRNVNRALSPVRDYLDPGLRRVLDAIENMDAQKRSHVSVKPCKSTSAIVIKVHRIQ